MSNETNNNEYLLKVDHLKQYFPVHDGFKKMELKAVDDVSFAIKPGETLGLVGESGCGKTTVGRTLLRLYQPTAGRIEFDGNVLFDSEKKIDVNMHPYRKQMQMVFQDPYSSLNPRMTVEDIIGEPLDVHKLYNSKKERLIIMFFEERSSMQISVSSIIVRYGIFRIALIFFIIRAPCSVLLLTV